METTIHKEDGGFLIDEPGRRKISTSAGAMAEKAIAFTKAEIKEALQSLKIGEFLVVTTSLKTGRDNPDPGTD